MQYFKKINLFFESAEICVICGLIVFCFFKGIYPVPVVMHESEILNTGQTRKSK